MFSRLRLVCSRSLFLLLATICFGQIDQPNGGPWESGDVPLRWRASGPDCQTASKEWETHRYNADLYILRESGCVNYEKPFLYLIFGNEKALLVDTGAGMPDTRTVVDGILKGWSAQHQGRQVRLWVTHSHGHGDHTAGDASFRERADTLLIEAKAAAEAEAFHIADWPRTSGQIDLGGRVIDVIPIPGHQAASLAFYDRRTGVLLTGDTLYPGRLYVEDWAMFRTSVERLVAFTQAHPVTHILGCHVEQMRQPYRDYPVHTVYQPEEHELALGRSVLLELLQALQQAGETPRRLAYRDFTIWPVPPKRRAN